MENSNSRINFLTNMLDLIDKMTWHGIPNVFRSEQNYKKLIWIIFAILSISFCIFLINLSILNYLCFDHVTNVDIIYEQPMTFPTISMCSISDKNRILSRVINSCIFNNENCLHTQQYFTTYLDPEYGKCFRFNSGKRTNGSSIDLLNSSLAGRSDGLQLEIDEPEGSVIFVHNSSTPPYSNQKFDNLNGYSIFVPAGFYTDLAIDKTVIDRLDEPYNSCVHSIDDFKLNKTLYQFILSNNQTYSQQRCFKLCFDLYYLNENICNCPNDTGLGEVTEKCIIQMTDNDNIRKCIKNKRIEFNKLNLAEKCKDYCPLECDTIIYTGSLSFYLNKKNDSIIRLKIYFRELRYFLIDQQPKMESIDLISAIGGLFGLCLGASFLSFIEILEILIEIANFSFKTINLKKIRIMR